VRPPDAPLHGEPPSWRLISTNLVAPEDFPPAGAAIWYTCFAMLKQSFRDFIFSTNTDGSGKAASYVRALDMLGPILMRHYLKADATSALDAAKRKIEAGIVK